MEWPDRLAPSPRALDWSLAAAILVLVATGVAGLLSGRPGSAWILDLHAVSGLALVVLVAWKLRRVAPRVRPERLTLRRVLSVVLAVTTLSAVGTGVWWALGGSLSVGPWGPRGLLMVHMILGALVPLLLVWHLRYRYHSPADLLRSAPEPSEAPHRGRRDALRYALVVGAGAVAWRSQLAVNDALDTAGADRRFTGSREEGSGEGNGFPVTSWVADDPDPVDVEEWSLRVDGRVADPRTFDLADLNAGDERRALLDCTSGWYSEHDWRGVSVANLLAAVDVEDGAQWIQFRSVTGYRWSLPVEEAGEALLATRVDGEELSHGHGAPLRLVAPGRRGFQWIKWVTEVRVTRRRDPGEWVAIFVSGFEE